MNANYDPYLSMPAMAEHDISRGRFEALVRTSEALKQTTPEYIGMTAFGSTVRGEARPDSDVDVYAYFDASMPSSLEGYDGQEFTRLDEGALMPGTYIYKAAMNWAYKARVGLALGEQGLADADVLAMPISPEIVTDQVNYALEGARIWNETGQGKAVAPRNIRGLFHAPVDSDGLAQYRKRVLDAYASSPHGETAWAMLRYMVATYEAGIGGDRQNPGHRQLPATLNEALNTYLDYPELGNN